MDNLDYLFVAFALVWVAIFAYFYSLDRRLNRLEARFPTEEDGDES